jgi:hypothetical protein
MEQHDQPGPGLAASTGDQRVDEAVRPASELAAMDVADHPAVYERIHAQLVQVLGEPDAGEHDGGRPGAPV